MILLSLCLGLQLYGQDTLAVRGSLADTLTINSATVTGQTQVNRIEGGAYAASAVSIRQQAASLQTISQAIEYSPGIRLRSQGGLGSDFDLSLNGLSGGSVRYFIDGVALDSKGSGITLANLPVSIIDRVEIYKGVVPATLGTDALGGAINIVTNRRSRNYLDVSYGLGSFHTHTFDFSAQYRLPRSGIILKPVLNAYYSKNDYTMRGVKVRNEDHTAFVYKDLPRFHDGYLSLFALLEAGVTDRSWADDFFVSASYSRTEKEIQTGATQSHVVGMAQRSSRALNLSARYSKSDFLAQGLNLKASFSHTRDHSQTIDTTFRQYYWDGTYIDGAYSEIRGRAKMLRNYLRPLTIGRATLDYAVAAGHTLTLNYMYNQVGNRQWDDYDKTYVPTEDAMTKHIAGLNYEQNLLQGRLENVFFVKDYVNALQVGQSEMASQTGSDKVPDRSVKNFFGYGLGSRYRFAEPLSLKASYEHSVRLPVSREMLGNGTTVYPNLTLLPEIGDNVNLGAFGTFDLGGGHLISYSANGFLRLVDNYIQATVMETEGMMQYVNVAAVHIKGVEGEIQYNWQGRLQLIANASYDDCRDMRQYTQSGTPSITYRNRTPNRPWAYCNVAAGYTFHNVGLKDSRLRLGCDYHWVHWFYVTWAAYGSASGKPTVPTQHIINASLLYSWGAGRYNVSLECTNLADRLAYDNYMLQKPGRAFFLKFNYYLCKR